MEKWDMNRPLNQWPLYDVEQRLDSYRQQLRSELRRYGISFNFHLWVSDEWFCPDGVPGFALPFYLFNTDLKRLHKAKTGGLEGRSRREILKLMRHELGHAIDNAFKLRKNLLRQELFGSSNQEYPDYYNPKVYSKNFVHYLGEGYAQSHPDEDFAETFAYWLDPDKTWRLKSFSKTVTKKLNGMDRLMKSIRGKSPVLKIQFRIDPIEKNKMKTKDFYDQWIRERRLDRLNRIDAHLQRSFPKKRELGQPLAQELNRHKSMLKDHICEKEGVHGYEADRALNTIIKRAERLPIVVTEKEFRDKSPNVVLRNYHMLKQQNLLAVHL